jgi:hypothetical protein
LTLFVFYGVSKATSVNFFPVASASIAVIALASLIFVRALKADPKP